MDELLEKYLSGEVEEAAFRAELDKLSPEDKTKLEDKMKSQKPDVFQEMKALRQEKNRLKDMVPPKNEPDPFAKQFREEQIGKAKTKFWADMGIEEKDRPTVESTFTKLDSGKIDSDLIYGDLKAAYAAAFPDKLIDAGKKLTEFEQNARDFITQGAGPNGTGGTGDGDKKFRPEVYQFVENARRGGETISLEAAERYLTKGLSRTIQ